MGRRCVWFRLKSIVFRWFEICMVFLALKCCLPQLEVVVNRIGRRRQMWLLSRFLSDSYQVWGLSKTSKRKVLNLKSFSMVLGGEGVVFLSKRRRAFRPSVIGRYENCLWHKLRVIFKALLSMLLVLEGYFRRHHDGLPSIPRIKRILRNAFQWERKDSN